METEIWKCIILIMLSGKVMKIFIRKMKWSAMVCFPMSHYIFTQSYELPYQNSGVYIKLDSRTLDLPNETSRSELSLTTASHLPSSFLPQAGATPWKSPRLYLTSLVIFTKPEYHEPLMLLSSSPLQAFLSAALVREEAQPLPVHRGLGMGRVLVCAAGLLAMEQNQGPDSLRTRRPCSFSVWVGNTSHVLHFLLGPYRLLNIYLSLRLFSFLRNPDSLASFSPFGISSQRGMWLTPLLPSEGALLLIDLAALGAEKQKGTRKTHDCVYSYATGLRLELDLLIPNPEVFQKPQTWGAQAPEGLI